MSFILILLALSASWLLLVFLRKYFAALSTLRSIRDCPGRDLLWLHPFHATATLLGSVYPFKGQPGYYYAKFSLYLEHGSTFLSSAAFWTGTPIYWVADADAVKAITSSGHLFVKDVEGYEVINIYGKNVVTTESSEWKRHKNVVKSAFNEANTAFVWKEATRIVNEWFSELENLDNNQDDVDLSIEMVKITLLILSSAGFGRRSSWTEEAQSDPPTGHRMAFRPALLGAVHNIYTKIIAPEWLYALSENFYLPGITPTLRDTKQSFTSLREHMLEIIATERTRVGGGSDVAPGTALLRNMVEANMIQEDGYAQKRLTDEELLSNTFTFLIAGHETTAFSLSFAIATLALYPDIQKKVYDEVVALWPAGAPSTATLQSVKECLPKLEYTTAVFHESLRHFPPVLRLGKIAQADTTLTTKRFSTTEAGSITNIYQNTVAIERGSVVLIDVLGLHMNPLHWGNDADKFKPERFIDTPNYRWPREAFMAFSGGPRSCIGHRFALAEGLCVLASLVRAYHVLMPQDLKNKSFSEQKQVLQSWKPGITTLPIGARVRLQRRP
ncbi:cytochrome P450 [Pluteus cervinus]|uniref:Cytochrome P450 n=1 Tax=Pluteus cervinus TaxID=181527 RepID=A0ACD3B354_9AGAR|nr:cytochrome P450 [Pluteus cervinus]